MGNVMPLVLGTAQLGGKYGIANRLGQPSCSNAFRILDKAWEDGIRVFDTAQAYGESELVLGNWIKSRGLGEVVKVITKLDPNFSGSVSELTDSVSQSCERLAVDSLQGFLLHGEALLNRCGVQELQTLKAMSLVQKVGISISDVSSASDLLRVDGVDAMQVPVSAFDHRLTDARFFDNAKESMVEIYGRSIYLQGLLLMEPEDVPDHVSGGRSAVASYRTYCEGRGISREAFAMGFVMNVAQPDYLVVGAETPEQVSYNISLLQECMNIDAEQFQEWRRQFTPENCDILDPLNWLIAEEKTSPDLTPDSSN